MANTYNWSIVQLDAKIHENEFRQCNIYSTLEILCRR